MTYFYAHLFAADSEISAMFPAAMHAQRQRFYRALCRIVAMASAAPRGPSVAAAQLTRYLAELGRAHRKYGVRKEHYASFRAALRTTADKFASGGALGAAPTSTDWEIAFDRATEIMISAAEEDAANAPAWWTAEVTRHELRTPGVAVLTMQPSEPFPHQPGQHLSVQTPRWPRIWRSYSIANAPRPDGSLTLHVRAVAGGLVSNTLVHHTAPGDMLLLGRAEGAMTADTESSRRRPVLCLAGGTGLAPLKAIAEAFAALEEPPEVVLYVGARTASELYDLAALRQMERDSPWLEIIPATSQEMAEGTRHGTIASLARKVRWQDRDVYVSGPDPMIAKTLETLRDAGAPAGLLHYDQPDEIALG
jgi:NAD(P)H-flavin reductase/hemoglobin-like flavoprotein